MPAPGAARDRDGGHAGVPRWRPGRQRLLHEPSGRPARPAELRQQHGRDRLRRDLRRRLDHLLPARRRHAAREPHALVPLHRHRRPDGRGHRGIDPRHPPGDLPTAPTSDARLEPVLQRHRRRKRAVRLPHANHRRDPVPRAGRRLRLLVRHRHHGQPDAVLGHGRPGHDRVQRHRQRRQGLRGADLQRADPHAGEHRHDARGERAPRLPGRRLSQDGVVPLGCAGNRLGDDRRRLLDRRQRHRALPRRRLRELQQRLRRQRQRLADRRGRHAGGRITSRSAGARPTSSTLGTPPCG